MTDPGADRFIGQRLHRAVFLDRDGTLIVERGYLSDPAEVELEAEAVAGLARLQQAGWLLVLVTNQSGVARGYFSTQDVDRVNKAVATLLGVHGIALDATYYCPHGSTDGCACRKPAPGLLFKAAEELDIDLGRSFLIGDKRSDLEAADRAGATGILVTTGYGATDRDWAISTGHAVVNSLTQAVAFMVK